MSTPLRVLMIEDSEDDARLLLQEMQRGGYDPQFTRVATAEAMRDELARQPWDLVLADYNLPSFNGLEALRILRESGGDLPFILVSGTVGEETSVEAMKAGAHDYLMKSNLTRLVPAVERELADARIRRQHKQAEQQLRQLSSAVNQSPVAIAITDPAGNITYVNPKFTAMSGYTFEEVLGKNPRILKSGETPRTTYEELWRTITSGKEWHGEFHNRRKDGELYWESASISPILDEVGRITHFLAVKEDITEKKNLQAQFLRAQRMEGIGHLAGGIAHDLNNILAPILLSIQMLRDEVKTPDGLSLLDMLETSARRGADIVTQVLTFARGAEGKHILLQPGHLVKEMVKIIHETFPKNITLKTGQLKSRWMISGDATQLHQVLLNLTVNARDAMPQGGTLGLVIEDVSLDAKAAKFIPGAQPGSYVLLKISDTGTGIAPEIADKIFDPFFTTKGLEKGTGLGLSTVLGIVKSHGGFIQFDSRVGRGTAFKVYLPAKTELIASAPAPDQATPPPGQGELVLIIDDETAVRSITRQTLESYGYRTLTVGNGADALARYTEKGSQINLVMTDMDMPGTGGVATITALRKLNPHARILVATGADLTNDASSLEQLNVSAILKKPFAAPLLLQTLHDILHPNQK